MKVEILDKIEDKDSKICYLCKTNLLDYLDSLADDFDKFDIQRKIVSNRYLDTLATTVFSNDHIPIITLVGIKGDFDSSKTGKIEVTDFRILDGLQRTWRLNSIKKLSDWLKKKYITDKELKEKFINANVRTIDIEDRKKIMGFGVSDFKQARFIANQIVESVGIDGVDDCLKNKIQWFELWCGLTEEDIVNKMLLLNAGHKTVSMRHQIELLYFDWFDVFSEGTEIKLVRDKDAGSPVSFLNSREAKQYRFSDLVLATIAFVDGEYKKIQSEVVEDVYIGNSVSEHFGKSVEFYRTVIKFIVKCDEMISERYGDSGRIWFGRENCLEAFMGAIGKICWTQFSGLDIEKILKELLSLLKERLQYLSLDKFDEGKNELGASKINIGQTTKKVVYFSIYDILTTSKPKCIDWSQEFRSVGE